MRRALLDYLSCPDCESSFELEIFSSQGNEIREGLLVCSAARHAYPIVRSIPRILANAFEEEEEFTAKHRKAISNYRKINTESSLSRVQQTRCSFGRQWNTYNVQRPEEDLAYFESKTGTRATDLLDKLVLDAGCGSGRYCKIAGNAQATVIGVDFSSAVETAARNTADMPNVHIIQADIFHLPFKRQIFDFIYSIGVLHHTPNTKKAFSSLVPFLREAGEIAVWLYPRWPLPLEWYNQFLRSITTRMSHERLHQIATRVEPIGLLKLKLLTSENRWQRTFGQLLRGLTIGISYHPDRELRICDTFDWFSPPYQWHHTNEEVESWFKEDGLVEIKNLSLGQVHYQHNYGNGVNFKARRRLVAS